MRIATWNVNSITVRKERLLAFLKRSQPDILCLQELKCLDEAFPQKEIEAAGYHAVSWGQKTYNGVALLSKEEITDVVRGPSDSWANEARLIGGRTFGINAFSVYVPNGQEVGSAKFQGKIAFLEDLRKFLSQRFGSNSAVILGGDFNIARENRDVPDPQAWHGQVLFSETEKRALANVMLSLGLDDAFRHVKPEKGLFSWWDYRAGAFEKNTGLRIDLVLTSAPLTARVTDAHIDREERRGEKPSDHAPVWLDLK